MSICADWLTPNDVCIDGVEARMKLRAIAQAQAWMYEATCGLFTGRCQSTIRLRGCGCPQPSCDHARRWHRRDLSPYVEGPVLSIDSVTIGDGEPLTNDEQVNWRLVNAAYIVPTAGGALDPWPPQDMNLPAGAPGTWSILVSHGNVPPAHVIGATAELAEQILKRCLGGECALPDNAVSMNQGGVTFEFDVPRDGRTGIPNVDTIIGQFPCRRQRRLYDPMDDDAEVTRVMPV